MAAQKKQEKRTYVRADLTTRVRVQPVSREAFEQHTSTRSGELTPGADGYPDDQLGYLAQRLNVIEEKLDRLLCKLDPETCAAEETVCFGTAQDVSGAGVKLVLEEAFEPGQSVLISLSVPGFSIGFLEAYGEIVRVTPIHVEERQSFETSIKFLVISEDEREKLISYSFRRQRQVIRDAALAKEENRGLSSHGK